MKPRTATQILILSTIAVWIAFDFYTYFVHGNPTTISVQFNKAIKLAPGVEALLWILVAHLCFRQTGPFDEPERR